MLTGMSPCHNARDAFRPSWRRGIAFRLTAYPTGVFGISHAQADAVRDGETDTTGLGWHVHVRDRLPMDILSQVEHP